MVKTTPANEGAALLGAGRSTPEPPPWSPLTELRSPAPFRPSSPWIPSDSDSINTTIPSSDPCTSGYLSLLVEAAEITRKRGRASDLSIPEVPEKQQTFRVNTAVGPREVWYDPRKIRRVNNGREKTTVDHDAMAGMTVLEKLQFGLGKTRPVEPQVAVDKYLGLSFELKNDQQMAPEIVMPQRLERKATSDKEAHHLEDRANFA